MTRTPNRWLANRWPGHDEQLATRLRSPPRKDKRDVDLAGLFCLARGVVQALGISAQRGALPATSF
jgi:hypothetical protein